MKLIIKSIYLSKSHFYRKKIFAYGFENRRTNKKLNKTGGAYGFDFFTVLGAALH